MRLKTIGVLMGEVERFPNYVRVKKKATPSHFVALDFRNEATNPGLLGEVGI